MKADIIHKIEAYASRVTKDMLLEFTREVGEKVFEYTPEEDGHAHTAWRVAFNQIPGIHFSQHPAESGDKKAVAAGEGHANLTGQEQSVTISNKLDFVRKLEYGLMIEAGVDGNTGRKVKKSIRPGQKGELYGARESGGVGHIFWVDESGRNRFAVAMRPRAGHYVETAIDVAARLIRKRHK